MGRGDSGCGDGGLGGGAAVGYITRFGPKTMRNGPTFSRLARGVRSLTARSFATGDLATGELAGIDLAGIDLAGIDLISTDIFDTVLMRDFSLQRHRFDRISRLAARFGAKRGEAVDGEALAGLRDTIHHLAYRAAAVERPLEDVRLADVHALAARLLDSGPLFVQDLLDAELQVEARCLKANRPFLAQLDEFARRGKRVIAVSDTYYAARDLETLLREVVGTHPIDRVYASSDLNLTKSAGGLFKEVAAREQVSVERILHLGDDYHADVRMARGAGWSSIHRPRSALLRDCGRAWHAIFHGLALQRS